MCVGWVSVWVCGVVDGTQNNLLLKALGVHLVTCETGKEHASLVQVGLDPPVAVSLWVGWGVCAGVGGCGWGAERPVLKAPGVHLVTCVTKKEHFLWL